MSEPWDATTEYRACYVSNMGMHDRKSEEYEKIVAKMMETRESPAPTCTTKSCAKDPYEAIVQRKMQEYTQKKQAEKQPQDTKSAAHEEDAKSPSVSEAEPTPAKKEAPAKKDAAFQKAPEPQSDDEFELAPKKKGPRKTFAAAKKRPQQRPRRAVRQPKHQDEQTLKPIFFRDPEHATAAEQKHLYGPFYVSWPKNKPMPSAYSELAKIYGRRYQ